MQIQLQPTPLSYWAKRTISSQISMLILQICHWKWICSVKLIATQKMNIWRMFCVLLTILLYLPKYTAVWSQMTNQQTSGESFKMSRVSAFLCLIRYISWNSQFLNSIIIIKTEFLPPSCITDHSRFYSGPLVLLHPKILKSLGFYIIGLFNLLIMSLPDEGGYLYIKLDIYVNIILALVVIESALKFILIFYLFGFFSSCSRLCFYVYLKFAVPK
jgi:hypothetical protein